MKETTFTFKLYTYENGFNQTVIRAKWVNRFWFDSWVTVQDIIGQPMLGEDIQQWYNREVAIQDLRGMCRKILRKRRDQDIQNKRNQLRLILIDKIEVDPSEDA